MEATPSAAPAATSSGSRWSIASLVPGAAALASYDRSWLPIDILAGLTLWGLLMPEAMAYSGIAGLPPSAGLYTLVPALLVYALFGTSRQLSIGATSGTAAVLASSLVAFGFATSDPAAYATAAASLVLVVGAVFVLAGILRLGFITQFISEPVMAGFVTGLATFIAVGQLNKLLGVAKPSGNTVEQLIGIVKSIPETNLATFAVGAVALALLFGLPLVNKRLPAGLIVLFGSIAVSSALNLAANYGVTIGGPLPQGLPTPKMPSTSLEQLLSFTLPAMGIVLVGFSEALGAAREFADRHGYRIDPNAELRAHGLANMGSALFGGMVAGGGMSATAVNDGAGARSTLSLVAAWVAVVATLLVLTPLFTSLPEAVLAALIIHAVWHLIASRKLQRFRSISTEEWALGLVAFFGVVLFNVITGMVVGIIAAIGLVAYRVSAPHFARLGRDSRTGEWLDLARHPDAVEEPGIMVVRLNGPIVYPNAQSARDAISALVRSTGKSVYGLVLEAGAQDSIDVTAADSLGALVKDLDKDGVHVVFADMRARVRVHLEQTHLVAAPSEDYQRTVDDAVAVLRARGRDTGGKG